MLALSLYNIKISVKNSIDSKSTCYQIKNTYLCFTSVGMWGQYR